MKKYRLNVAAIIQNKKGKILVGERVKIKSAWQFPQGGIEKRESPKKALFREIKEEVGIDEKFIKIIAKKGGYKYKFPKKHTRFNHFIGQQQIYYLCEFTGKEKDIKFEQANQEFCYIRWIQPKKFRLKWLPRFKIKVYKKVFRDFFQLKIR